jgi:hypothetical protein
MKIITRGAIIRLIALVPAVILFCIWGYLTMIKMPGKNYKGPLPQLTEEQIHLKEQLTQDVQTLAGQIGERNTMRYEKLNAAADFIEKSLTDANYKVCRQEFIADGKKCYNLEAESTGSIYPDKIIVVGAHYDSVYSSPGANDNGSGVAATLALARLFAGKPAPCTLRFVLFANEEPPFYHTDEMGSFVYAKECKQKNEKIIAMLSLETIGCYTDEPHSQKYPFPFNLFYPSTGNFIGFVGNISNGGLVRKVTKSFRKNCQFPSQAGAVPGFVPGIDWSDHWSFWQQGYPAIMVTDTAPYRYHHYHQPSDTPEKIDYGRLARVTAGLAAVLNDLSQTTD